MRDTELYRQVLGLESPWEVARVELSTDGGQVDVWVRDPRGTRWTCPECERELPTYDHGEEREWRHLDTCQFLTFLHASPPRVECPEHGVLRVRLPWADPMSRFTTLFERLAVDVLKECDVAGAGRLLRTSYATPSRVLLGLPLGWAKAPNSLDLSWRARCVRTSWPSIVIWTVSPTSRTPASRPRNLLPTRWPVLANETEPQVSTMRVTSPPLVAGFGRSPRADLEFHVVVEVPLGMGGNEHAVTGDVEQQLGCLPGRKSQAAAGGPVPW
jgi:hypothetical protein